MDAHKLLKDELEYELEARGLSKAGTSKELKFRLHQAFACGSPVLSTFEPGDFQAEIDVVKDKLALLIKGVSEFAGKTRDKKYKYFDTRLWHLMGRVQRLKYADNDQKKSKEEVKSKIKSAIEELENKVGSAGDTEVDSSDVDNGGSKTPIGDKLTVPKFSSDAGHGSKSNLENAASQELSAVLPGTQAAIGTSFRNKSIPVVKWSLKFTGEHGGMSIGAFLERVEELRVARGVTEDELFVSAVDLFEGPALVWFRSTKRRVSNWSELKAELKIGFQRQDYEDRLRKEIENRTQGDSESIDIYLAVMDNLYARLSQPVSEAVMLGQVMKNLNGYLQDKLCLVEVRSIDELRSLARRAEMTRARSSKLQPPPRPNAVLEPDLAFNRQSVPNRMPVRPKPNVSLVEAKERKPEELPNRPNLISKKQDERQNAGNSKCWNCQSEGHNFSNCNRTQRVPFCYRCGRQNTIKANCDRCNGTKNLRQGMVRVD